MIYVLHESVQEEKRLETTSKGRSLHRTWSMAMMKIHTCLLVTGWLVVWGPLVFSKLMLLIPAHMKTITMFSDLSLELFERID
jgi:hypothetical protein